MICRDLLKWYKRSWINWQANKTTGLGTSYEALGKMSFIEQMDYVEKYLNKNKDKMNTLTDFYLQVLKPSAVGQGNNPNYAVFDESISVPDGDGSGTTQAQRMININREPWVTKYGYASNRSFMKEDKETERRSKWAYTRQRYEMRPGFIGGKTYIWEIEKVLKEQHYDKGFASRFAGQCVDQPRKDEPILTEGRAPWMNTVVDEAKVYGGKKQSIIQERVSKYHKEGANYNSVEDAWCASFASWCLENSNPPFKSPHTAGSRFFINHSTFEKSEAFYGAIAVFSDCSEDGKTIETSGHVSFLFGKLSSGKHLVLGGNQGGMIKVSIYDCSGSVFYSHYSISKKRQIYKIFRGFYKPKGYVIQEKDKLKDSDTYVSVDEANGKIGLGSVKSVSGEADD